MGKRDNPMGLKFNCQKSCGSGSKNRAPIAGDICITKLCYRSVTNNHTQLTADSVDSLQCLHSALNDKC